MIAVSQAWEDLQNRFILPETFVEISCAITEEGLQESATASATDEAVISEVESVLGTADTETIKKYATLEPNLWALDGSHEIFSGGGNIGYVSGTMEAGSVTLSLTEVHTEEIPGVTIVWSSEYNEYATIFTVEAKNGDTVVATTTVTDNTSPRSDVYLPITNYDSVTITVHAWCLPDRRVRIDSIYLGFQLLFEKVNLMSFTHEQHGCLNSGELPKNSISFSLDNSDGRWNPSNPTGIEQYLSERQKLTVRYGLDVDGTTEWIKGGTFYLSEWEASSNGIEASFVARDIFEFMLNTPYTGTKSGTLEAIANAALALVHLPSGITVSLDDSLSSYTASFTDDYTVAEILQLCANAAACVMYQDRDGNLWITPPTIFLGTDENTYTLGIDYAYSYPEYTLSKKLKSTAVSYGDEQTYTQIYDGSDGETQTVDNPLISTAAQAEKVASGVWWALSGRTTITGEYRADPRLDVFDAVYIESKYAAKEAILLTDVTYTYSGVFKATVSGRNVLIEESVEPPVWDG